VSAGILLGVTRNATPAIGSAEGSTQTVVNGGLMSSVDGEVVGSDRGSDRSV